MILKELGGWSSIRMVEKYTHLDDDFLSNYADHGFKRTKAAGVIPLSKRRQK
ncbi:MAG: hypothetical protein ACR2RB_08110 [Gammaproteobacteria bacterium]